MKWLIYLLDLIWILVYLPIYLDLKRTFSMFFSAPPKKWKRCCVPNIHSPFFCFSNFNWMTRTHGHLPTDCFSHCPLQSVTICGPVGQCKNYVQLLDYFLRDKAALPVHSCFSYSWPRTAAGMILRSKDGSHMLKMMQPTDQSEFLGTTHLPQGKSLSV